MGVKARPKSGPLSPALRGTRGYSHGTSLWPAQDRGNRPLLRADLERHGRVHEAPLWLRELEHVKGLQPHEGTDIRINGPGYRSEGYRKTNKRVPVIGAKGTDNRENGTGYRSEGCR